MRWTKIKWKHGWDESMQLTDEAFQELRKEFAAVVKGGGNPLHRLPYTSPILNASTSKTIDLRDVAYIEPSP